MLTPDFLNHGMDRFTYGRPKGTLTKGGFIRAYRSDGQRTPSGNPPDGNTNPESTEANIRANPGRESIDAARSLLKEKGFMVISQRAFDDIIAEKYAKAYEKARQEARQNAATEAPEGTRQSADTALSSLENSIRQQDKNTTEAAHNPSPDTAMRQAETSHTPTSDRLKPVENIPEESTETSTEPGDPPEINTDTQSLAQIIQHYETLLESERAQGRQAQSQLAHWQQAQKALLLKAAIQPWAIDPELVFSLTETLFELQPHGGLGLVSAAGKPDASDEPTDTATSVDLAQFFEQFRAERPYLVKASISHGAGSLTETGATGGKIAVTLEQLAELPMEQFIRAGGLTGNTR